ncbi:cytotoxic T-lymphocyte protein 4 [Epinephelus moara]|uniref:cytotoxic T-lymphocyte protein 4 n=1 Tax=Epinephelus moara TaxID=300413 RepID=UPI00214EBE9B|nr:cytotoxic T-lymphocyte protein 4 [Epinephelus moara]
MFLTHCVMVWILGTVLSLCLPVCSAVKVTQPYKVVSSNGTARVQCFVQPQPSFNQIQAFSDQTQHYPYPDPEELRVTLLKGLYGTQELCSSMLNFTDQVEEDAKKEREVQCSAQLREGAVEVTVSGLKAKHTDMYRCKIEVFYPPPYLRLTGNGTLIHVLESSDCPVLEAQRQTAHRGDEEEDDDGTAPVSVPVVVLVILVMFVLIIIIYFQALQCKQERREIVRAASAVLKKVDAAAFSC